THILPLAIAGPCANSGSRFCDLSNILIDSFHVEQVVRTDLFADLQCPITPDTDRFVIPNKRGDLIFVRCNIKLGQPLELTEIKMRVEREFSTAISHGTNIGSNGSDTCRRMYWHRVDHIGCILLIPIDHDVYFTVQQSEIKPDIILSGLLPCQCFVSKSIDGNTAVTKIIIPTLH